MAICNVGREFSPEPSHDRDCFVPIPYCLDDYSFVVEAKAWDCDASCFGLLLNITLAIRGLLWFHTNFRIACSSFEKNAGAILIGTCTECVDSFV